MVEHVYENSYQHDPGGTFVPCTCRPQQHYVPIPGPQSAQRTSLTIPMMKHERQAALGPDDSSRAVGHSERVFLDRGTRTETSYTPSRTSPRCRPPVPGHQPRRGRRRAAGTPAPAGRSHACAPDSRRPVPRGPNRRTFGQSSSQKPARIVTRWSRSRLRSRLASCSPAPRQSASRGPRRRPRTRLAPHEPARGSSPLPATGAEKDDVEVAEPVRVAVQGNTGDLPVADGE